MREASKKGEKLGLTDDEWAFYDALGTNESAVSILGNETLRGIARELVNAVRANITIDWTVRENVRAQLRVIIKRILRKYGYPPEKTGKGHANRVRTGRSSHSIFISNTISNKMINRFKGSA